MHVWCSCLRLPSQVNCYAQNCKQASSAFNDNIFFVEWLLRTCPFGSPHRTFCISLQSPYPQDLGWPAKHAAFQTLANQKLLWVQILPSPWWTNLSCPWCSFSTLQQLIMKPMQCSKKPFFVVGTLILVEKSRVCLFDNGSSPWMRWKENKTMLFRKSKSSSFAQVHVWESIVVNVIYQSYKAAYCLFLSSYGKSLGLVMFMMASLVESSRTVSRAILPLPEGSGGVSTSDFKWLW